MAGARLSSLVLVVGLSLGAVLDSRAPQTAVSLTTDELFRTTKVWTVHLTLANDTFSALTPAAPPPGSPNLPPPAPQPPSEIPSVLPPDLLKWVLGGFVGPEGGRNGISAARGIDFEYVRASLDLDGMHFEDVAVRPKGNGTYGPIRDGKFAKPSLKIDLNKYVKGQKIAGVSTINLHNSMFDPTWMNETLALRLYRDAGVPTPRTAYARVYVTAKGGEPMRSLGLYTMVENVDSNFTDSRYDVKGGALYKPVTVVPFKFLGHNWADYNQMYDPKTDLTNADKQRVMDFSELLSDAPDDQFNARLGDYLDLDAFATYMAVVVWMANPDSVLEQGQNYYVFVHPKTNKFHFVPWDQDHSFGQFVPFRTAESQQQLNVMRPWVGRFEKMPFAAQVEHKLLARTLKHEAFKKRYLSELDRITRTVTLPDRLAQQVDELVPLLKPIVAEEPKDGRVISFDAAVGHGTFKRPFNPTSPDVNSIKVFLPLRQASVLAQLKTLGVQ